MGLIHKCQVHPTTDDIVFTVTKESQTNELNHAMQEALAQICGVYQEGLRHAPFRHLRKRDRYGIPIKSPQPTTGVAQQLEEWSTFSSTPRRN